MCKHENLAKISKYWRCRDCGEVFTEKPEVKAEPKTKPEVKKAPVKKTAKKGAK
jgi:transposase-like protein